MVDGDDSAPQAVLLHRGHSAFRSGIDRGALGGFEIQAVMGAPFAQSGVLDQFAVGLGVELLTGYGQRELQSRCVLRHR